MKIKENHPFHHWFSIDRSGIRKWQWYFFPKQILNIIIYPICLFALAGQYFLKIEVAFPGSSTPNSQSFFPCDKYTSLEEEKKHSLTCRIKKTVIFLKWTIKFLHFLSGRYNQPPWKCLYQWLYVSWSDIVSSQWQERINRFSKLTSHYNSMIGNRIL